MTSSLTSPIRRRPALAVAAGFTTGVLALLALTGCSGSPASPAAGTAPAGTASAGAAPATAGATSVQQQARVVWLDYARCVRSHGFPDFPDPRVDSQGQASIPGSSTQDKREALQAQGACGTILNRLPASARNNPPVTAAGLHEETLWAACMRRHGLPDWPDPRPDGSFALSGTPYASMGKTGPVAIAIRACQQYDTFGGVRGS